MVRTIILDNTNSAKSAPHRCVCETEANIVSGVWMWCTDELCSDDGRLGAAAASKNGNELRSRWSILATRRMEVLDTKLWAI